MFLGLPQMSPGELPFPQKARCSGPCHRGQSTSGAAKRGWIVLTTTTAASSKDPPSHPLILDCLLHDATALLALLGGWITGGWAWVSVVAGGGGIGFLGLWLLFSWKRAATIAGVVVIAIDVTNDLHGLASSETQHPGAPAPNTRR